MAPKSKDRHGSQPAARQPGADNTPPHSPDPIHRLPHAINHRMRTPSRESIEADVAPSLSGLLRRTRPQPAPIDIPQLTYETPPPTAVETSPPPPLPTPILESCPGREILGAKPDGREWACDFDDPPVLICPKDLSKTDFHEHPLARHIELEKGWEKHQLALYGLILPGKIDNGAPIYTWESDPEDEAGPSKALVRCKAAKMPAKPLPPTKRPRTPSNILHKVKSFANFAATCDLEGDVPELPTLRELLDQFGMPPGSPTEPVPRVFLRPTRSSSSLRPKSPLRSVPSATKLRRKRSAGVEKSEISEPVAPEEMRRSGSDFGQAVVRRKGTTDSERTSFHSTSLRSPSNLVSPSALSNLPLYLLQPQHPTVYLGKNEAPPKFRHAPPRLSPMEYARRYLISKAEADGDGEECTTCKPDLIWAWTEDYKEFLLLPRIPEHIQRNFLPDDGKDWKKSDLVKSVAVIDNKGGAKRCSFTPLPLNLAPLSPLWPACFLNDSHSSASSTHKRTVSIDYFSLNQPVATESQTLPQSDKSLFNDPSASIPRESTDVFVAVHTNSESEFANFLPPQLAPPSTFHSDSGPRQDASNISERAASAAPHRDAFTATPFDIHASRQFSRRPDYTAGVSAQIATTRLSSAAHSQRNIAATTTHATTQEVHRSLPAHSKRITECARGVAASVFQTTRPTSALSYRTVVGPNSPVLTADRDENNVSPNNDDYDGLPPAPVSPLSSPPESAQTEVFAPSQVTRMLETHHTLDDAQTQQTIDDTFLQSISDDGADFADTSSVYSQDSFVTVVRHPVAGLRHKPLDFMSPAYTADGNKREDLTPRHQENLSFEAARSRARTLQHSPALPPLSYIPNTEAAHRVASSEESHAYNADRRYQAPSSIISTVSTSAAGSIADHRDRRSTASEASAGSHSVTSVSTYASRRSQASVSAPRSLPGRSTASKHVRSSRIEGTAPKTPSNTSHQNSNICRLPALVSVAEGSFSSPGLRLSATSPAVNSAACSRQRPQSKQTDSSHKDAVTRAIESRNTDRPPIKVRRRRVVDDLPYIPASQIYPRPLRISAMKSPSPASTTPTSGRATSGAGTGTVVRSTSRLITDVNAQLRREMEEVLSPRTAALVAASDSAKEGDDVDTPTRRPPRPVRSLPKPTPWSPPIHAPPNKPLPPIPQKKTRPESASRLSVDDICGPSPAVSIAPAPPRPPPPIPTSTPDFSDPYPPPRVIWTDGDVTVSDFSIPKRIVRPAASMAAISHRPTPLMDQRQQQVRRRESAANLQRPAPATAAPPVPAPSGSRLLGKVVSMAELKHRRETCPGDGRGSDDAIDMRIFLGETTGTAPVSAKEKSEKSGRSEKSSEGSKKKFFGNLFRRNKKDGEK